MARNRFPTFFPERTDQRVPSMGFVAGAEDDGILRIDFGAPATLDADGLIDGITMVNGSAVTATRADMVAYEIPGPFGRRLTAVASSTNTRAVTITGIDFLGNKVVETHTLTSTTAITTKKCFKWLTSILFASASDTTTVDVGWNNDFALPYNVTRGIGEFIDEVYTPLDQPQNVSVAFTQTELLAPSTLYVTSPVRGYVVSMDAVLNLATTTGVDTITATIGGTAISGLSVAPTADTAAGTAFRDTIAYGVASALVAAGGAIAIVPGAGFTSTGSAGVTLGIQPAFVVPGDATTATATTTDVRGYYTPTTTPDGAKHLAILVAVNRTNLHGVAQYAG